MGGGGVWHGVPDYCSGHATQLRQTRQEAFLLLSLAMLRWIRRYLVEESPVMSLTTKPKEILPSKRGNIQYIEHCRVLVKDGRVLYLHADEKRRDNTYWNIPIANTSVVLLGTGTSITQAAVRMMVDAGVMLGFCGTGGTPLFSATEVEWFSPQSEYRPTEYVQKWLSFWFDDTKRLRIAKHFQHQRLSYINAVWKKSTTFKQSGLQASEVRTAADEFAKDVDASQDVQSVLASEGRFAKQLYKYVANHTGATDFVRDPEATDSANRFLSHGNYLAYGLAATCLWCLGIPHGFAVMHGKTRRGALVFDVADLVKDAIVLPQAFIASQQGLSQKEFREACIVLLSEMEALEFMFNTVKAASSIGESLS